MSVRSHAGRSALSRNPRRKVVESVNSDLSTVGQVPHLPASAFLGRSGTCPTSLEPLYEKPVNAHSWRNTFEEPCLGVPR